jgi:hypothetical protein
MLIPRTSAEEVMDSFRGVAFALQILKGCAFADSMEIFDERDVAFWSWM